MMGHGYWSENPCYVESLLLQQLFVSDFKLSQFHSQCTIACSNSMKWIVAYAAVQALKPVEDLVCKL